MDLLDSMEDKATKDLRENQDHQVTQEPKADLDPVDREVHLDRLENGASRELMDHLEEKVYQDSEDHRVLTDHLETLELKDLLDHPDLLDQMDPMANADSAEVQEVLDSKVLLVALEQLEELVPVEPVELQDLKAGLELRVQLVLQDREVRTDLEDSPVPMPLDLQLRSMIVKSMKRREQLNRY